MIPAKLKALIGDLIISLAMILQSDNQIDIKVRAS